MTLALIINIILAAIVFAAIVGALTWSIMTSGDGQTIAPTTIKRLRVRSTDGVRGTLSRLRADA